MPARFFRALPLLALLLPTPARARCTLAALETRVDPAADGGLDRTDRWTWRVEGGRVDCAAVDFASPSAAPIRAIHVEVQRPDGRDPRIGPERIEAVALARDPGFGPSPGLRVHAPELREGDLLLVEVERPWPASPGGLAWRPGARGPLEIATLDHPQALAAFVELPHAPETDLGPRQLLLLEGVPAGLPEALGSPVLPEGTTPPEHRSELRALLLPTRKPLRALGDAEDGQRLEAGTQRGGAAFRLAPPRDALLRWCRAGGQDCPLEGGVAWNVDPTEGAAWGWVRPGTWPSGELRMDPAGHSSVVVLAPLGELDLQGPAWARRVDLRDLVLPALLGLEALPEGLEALLAGSAPLRSSAQLLWGETRLPTELSWRLAALDGVPVLPDASAAWQLIARLGVLASIPEPGVPTELKGRRADPQAVPEVLEVLRARMHPGALPGAPELLPRGLVRARRSGWGNPWELALVLARYLNQLRLPALPVPVRPLEAGMPDAASVSAWPQAVVRVRLPGGDLWVDPSCGSCAPGQLLPALDGAWAQSPELEALPALPASSWHRRTDASGAVELEVRGPLAVALREALLDLAPEARGPWLAQQLGGAGARLVAHEGLVSAGEALVLRLEAPGPLPPPLLLPEGEAGPLLWLPARGTWTEDRPLPEGAAAEPVVEVSAPGLRWTRGPSPEGTWRETLVVEERGVERAGAEALLGRLEQAWGRPRP